MAGCTIKIKAPNGKESNLFKSILKANNNPAEAVQLYYYTKTAEFKKVFGDYNTLSFDKSKLDSNREPSYSLLSDEGYLHDVDFATVELDNKAKVYKKLAEVMPGVMETIDDKVRYLENTEGNEETLAKLKTLQEVLTNEAPEDSIPKFIEMAGVHVKALKNRAEKESKAKNPDVRKLAGLNKAAQSYGIVKEIRNSLLGDKEVRAIFEGQTFDIGSTLSDVNEIESLYITESKDYLVNEFSKRDPSWSKDDIRQWLDSTPRDVKFTERMFEYIGDSHDKVLSMVGEVVRNAEHSKRRSAIEFNEQLSEVLGELEKVNKGGNAEAVFGEIMTTKENGEVHVLDISAENTNGKDAVQDAEYRKVQNIKNTQPELYNFLEFYSDTYSKMQKLVNVDLGTRLPAVLKGLRERTQTGTAKNVYDQLSDDVKKSFQASNLDMERGMLLDSAGNPVKKIPVFYTQKYDSVDYKNAYEAKLLELLDAGKKQALAEDQANEHAEKVATENMSKLISKDLAGSLQAFHSMATNYAEKMAIIDIVDSATVIVGSDQRKVAMVDSGGIALMKKIKGSNDTPLYKPGSESDANKMLQEFVDTQVYGQSQKDLGYVDIPFLGKIDVNKSLRQLNNYTSLAQIALNITASIANIGNGEHNNLLEVAAGEFYNLKSYKAAGKMYRNNLSGMLADVGERTPSNLVNMMNEHYDMLQDFQASGTIKGVENSKAKRLFKTDALFFMNNAGEHFMQTRSSMAIMANTPTFTESGVEVGNVLEAHSIEDGKLKVADVYVKGKDGALTKYDSAQQDRMTNKMSAINRKLQGNYSKQTAAAVKKDARLALMMKFRDWAYEGLVRRYGKKQYNRGMEMDTEGFYRTSGKFIGNLAKNMKGFQLDLIKADWQALTPHEKANIRRTATEFAMIAALSIGGTLLGKAGKMIEDDYPSDSFYDQMMRGTYMFTLYETNRLYTELFAFMSPTEALRLMQSPAAATSLIESTFKLLNQLTTDPLEQYTRGWRKGDYKAGRQLEKLLPGYKHIATLNEHGMKEKGVFYNIK